MSSSRPGIGATGADATAAALRSGRAEAASRWRSFRAAARLGFDIEANWADPLPFLIYTVIKPVFATLILVVMLEIISGGRTDPGIRAFVVVGSALWSFTVAGVAGFAQAVLEDRERYRMLKYLYVSPNDFLTLLLGRGIWRLAIGAFGALVTLALGTLFLGVPFTPGSIDWPLLALATAVGIAAVVALGMTLAAVTMQTRQDSWQYPEAVTGALFLVVGAVFPLTVLPGIVQAAGLLVPLTWWLEAVRRAVFPGIVSSIGGEGSLYTDLTGAAAPGTTELAVGMVVTTVLAVVAAALAFSWSEHRAKERGLFDQTTGS